MGEWVKGVKGNLVISVTPESTAALKVYDRTQWVIPLVPPYWKLHTTIAPGATGYMDNADGDIKLEVDGRKFLSASDVPGGVDAHFEGLWLSLRHR